MDILAALMHVILSKIWAAVEKEYEVVSSMLSNEYGLARLSR